MRQTTRRLVFAATGMALAASMMGCGGGTTDPTQQATQQQTTQQTGQQADVSGATYDGPAVTLELWNPFTGPDGAYFKKMVDDFNAEHENVRVNVTTMQAGDMYTKLPVAVRSGSGPDVAIIHLHAVGTVASGGSLLGLDSLAEGLELKAEDFAPAVWEGAVYKGTRYAIPLDVHTLGLFYNKTVLQKAGLNPDQPPQTHDEYMTALQKVREAGLKGQWIDSYGFMRLYFVSLLHQYGGQEFNDTGDEALWNSEAGVKALTWLQDLIKNGDSPENVGADGYWAAFKNNETAFVWGGIWALGDPDLANIEWGVAPFPVIGDQAAVWADSHQFVLTSQTKDDENKRAAAAFFINEISSNSLEWAKANQIPARASVRDSAELKDIPGVPVFAGQIDHVVMPRVWPGLDEANEVLTEEMNKVLLLQKEPKAALDDAVSRANPILKANKQKYEY